MGHLASVSGFIFGGSKITADGDCSHEIKRHLLLGRKVILNLLVKSGLCTNNSDARRNVQQGGVSVNNSKVSDIRYSVTPKDIAEGIILKKGKKNFCRVLYK